jgi:hypothetical protein
VNEREVDAFVNQNLCFKIQLKDSFNKTSEESNEVCTTGKKTVNN